jgi:hypothetical protein
VITRPALPARPTAVFSRKLFALVAALCTVVCDARILREEETTPNHLITSTFEYTAAKR